jgi:hypothetical protein
MPKKTKNQRPTVKVRDLKPKKDAKGGSLPLGHKTTSLNFTIKGTTGK